MHPQELIQVCSQSCRHTIVCEYFYYLDYICFVFHHIIHLFIQVFAYSHIFYSYSFNYSDIFSYFLLNNLGAGEDKTGGHTLCVFCEVHFFDAHGLYLHMRNNHQSCHLCAAEFQHRYYPSIDELRTHFRSEHYVCDICDTNNMNGIEGVGDFSFRNHKDYSTHLLSYHGVKNASMTLGFRHSSVLDNHDARGDGGRGRARGRGRGVNRPSFIDLDMSRADPYRNSANQSQQGIRQGGRGGGEGRSGRGRGTQGDRPQSQEDINVEDARRRQLFYLQTNAAIAAEPLIPEHMRVAGRVVGGSYSKHADDDLLQAMADEQAQASLAADGGNSNIGNSAGRGGNWAGRPNSGQNINMNFPSLSATTNAPMITQNSSQEVAPSPHPLSLVHIIQRDALAKKALEDEKKALDSELEERKLRRNKLMAGAFGVGNGSISQADVMFDPSELQRPLYPPLLLTWARINKGQIIKLEKKMMELIADKKANSTQLKPMGGSARGVVHGLSRYYFLNSYEYDQEPKRYVSLVKSIESSLPPLRLSR